MAQVSTGATYLVFEFFGESTRTFISNPTGTISVTQAATVRAYATDHEAPPEAALRAIASDVGAMESPQDVIQRTPQSLVKTLLDVRSLRDRLDDVERATTDMLATLHGPGTTLGAAP